MMVSLVPPLNGPEVGETELNTGEGHWFDVLAKIEEQVSGATQLIPLHHPQSYPVPMLTARQEMYFNIALCRDCPLYIIGSSLLMALT